MISMIFSLIFAYILGSVPSGLIIGKSVYGVDLREHGSKNIGATNAWRTLGKAAGFLIFVCDFLKGFISVYIAAVLSGTPLAMALAGALAIIGHSLSIFLKFKGGKGVATGLGVIAMLMGKVTIIVFLIWFAIVYFTRYVSLGSCVAAAFVPILAYVFNEPSEFVIFGVVVAVLIIVRHKANIERLLNGTESKISAAKK
ncbi:MAG: glycerol-3-phosphate 1-O-acyltransferase PlsY [Selenomonadaceae bacterium]|nr:glycerol-3-phosphate 1-O-acyltransferase PlsY [Selenomonadaceae bacterium]